MEEKASFLFGATFKTRLPTGPTTILSATMNYVKLGIESGPTKTKSGKQTILLQAKIGGKDYPLRYQTAPFIISGKQELKKKHFKFSIVDFEYKSNLSSASAAKCRTDLELLDTKIIQLLIKHKIAIWPKEDLSNDEVAGKYQGFMKDRLWTPPEHRLDNSPQHSVDDSMDEAVIEDPDSENPKLVYEPGVKKIEKKENRKRKAEEAELEEPSTDKFIIFPPKLRIFPRSSKAGPCKIIGQDGSPLLLSALSVGLEVVAVFDISLTISDGMVQPSCTGLQFTIKEDHREPASFAASDAYVGESY